jgi:hypothetical protein
MLPNFFSKRPCVFTEMACAFKTVSQVLGYISRTLYTCMRPFHALMNLKERLFFWLGILLLLNALFKRAGWLWLVLGGVSLRQSLKPHWHWDNIQVHVKPHLKKEALYLLERYL